MKVAAATVDATAQAQSVSPEPAVLVWTPKGRDAQLAADLLGHAGVRTVLCSTVSELCDKITENAGCAIVTEEILSPAARRLVEATLARQPPWSDFPFIVFSPHGIPLDQMNEAVKYLGNTTIQDRPVKARTLLSAVHAALMARRRQYQARDAIDQRDQFLAMLGHELRNPLSAIVLATEMLNRTAGEVGKKHRGIIERQSQHLARLVDDLLDVSRITTGKVVLQRSHLDLNELLMRCTSALEAKHGTSLELDLPPTATWVNGDAVRLEQVFSNLLNNARKYSPVDAKITVRTRTRGSMAEIVVEDTGVGIAPDMLPRIFDLFTQAKSSIDRAQGGMGIGLTLVKRLVEMHHGTVEVASPGLGFGSTFSVRLPLEPAPAPETQPERAAMPRVPIEVVLVEDNPDIRETSRELLEALGCVVTVGADGPSGLAAIVERRPAVALVDIGLPIFDGYTVARRAREALGDEVVLVALTGYGLFEDRRQALAAGFDEHLTKPVASKDLLRILDRAASSGRESRPDGK